MTIHEQDKQGYRALTVALYTGHKSITNYINATWYTIHTCTQIKTEQQKSPIY